ncbi:hypothetical protein LCGC14_1160930 [marine sediment metagenome]|uniref:Ribbon-helix-helix protein CopG domain-containing protein n=1 Tax=marine sediment metagenome TaxID=412755 RepID=A0A0F9LSG8_9ZZZZ
MTGKRKNIQFNFLLTEDLYEKLEEIADQNYSDKSTTLRQLISKKYSESCKNKNEEK